MRLQMNESDTASYRKDLDNVTSRLSYVLNETATLLDYIRYHFDDEDGIKDTDFDAISPSEYENMIAKLKDYEQYASYMLSQISKMNKKFDDSIR